ncbi:MAG: PAS domain S-box-containing protein, partial [bacterium]
MPTDAELLKIIGFFLVVGIYIYFLKKGFKQKLKKVTFSQSQIEENLKELQQYQSLSENMVGMLALVDSNYKINLANSAYEQAYSKGDYSLLGSSIIETVGIGDFEEFLKDKIDCSFQGECVDDQLWINFPQSGRKYMRFSYTPVEIESQIKYVAVHALDFTQDKLNEENLAKHKHQYQTIFNCMQDGFALFQGVKEKEITADYSIIDVNPAFEKILNQKAEFLIGKKIQNVFPNYSKDWVSFFHRIIRTSIPEKIELEFQETQQIFELFVFPLEKNQIATIVKDITNSKIVEKLKETHSEDLEQQEKNLHYEVLLITEV